SSNAFVCSDCAPPATAESAWIATRTMLFSGCCAVRVEPPVCAWKRSASARGFVAPKRSFMIRAHSRLAARNFATSWKKWLCALKKKESRAPNSSGERPASTAAEQYAIPFARVKASSWTAVEPAERDPIEQDLHVRDRVDRDAGPAHLALRARIVGVVPELRRQVERDRQPVLPALEQVSVARVRLLGGGESGVLADRPRPPPVHV